MAEINRPNDATYRAQELCAEWLVYCLHIGWSRSMLDKLENLWWEHHDRYGELK